MTTLFATLLGISAQLFSLLLPLITKQAGASLSVLLPIALNIVQKLVGDKSLTNPQKREKAVEELSQAAVQEGLNAATSLLNLAVEMAVNKLKVSG
jgi:hypothetical protein